MVQSSGCSSNELIRSTICRTLTMLLYCIIFSVYTLRQQIEHSLTSHQHHFHLNLFVHLNVHLYLHTFTRYPFYPAALWVGVIADEEYRNAGGGYLAIGSLIRCRKWIRPRVKSSVCGRKRADRFRVRYAGP